MVGSTGAGSRRPRSSWRRRSVMLVVGVLVWAVTALAAAGWLFLHTSRDVVVATHDARVSPILTENAVIRTGPVLPDARIPLDGPYGLPLGVEIILDKTTAASLPELFDRYAFIGSQPDGQVAKVGEAMREMAYDSAVRGALVGLVPIGLWVVVGRRRRRELLRSRRGVLLLVLGCAGVVAGAVMLRPWEVSDVTVQEQQWTPIGDFLGLPVPDELTPVEVSGDILTAQTKRLVESALSTYDKSKVFYGEATQSAAELELREPEEGDTVVLLVSDRHDNIGMDPVARAVADRAGATAVFDAGDDTSSGRPWEAFSLDSVTKAFEDLPRWSVTGNHDHGDFVGDYLGSRGWVRLNGRVVDGPGGTTILGVDDPRASGLGDWRNETGLTFSEVAERVTEAACEQDEPVTTLLVHDVNLGDEALRQGCVQLVVGGHTHVARGPIEVIGPEGEIGHELTNGTTGGAAYAVATGSKPRRPAVVSLVTYREGAPVGTQQVTLDTDGTWQVGEYAELRPQTSL